MAAPVHPKAAEARAVLRSVRANLCPHGVRWRDCNDHEKDEVVDGATEGASGGLL